MRLKYFLPPIFIGVLCTQTGCFLGAAVGSGYFISTTIASAVSYAVSGKTLTDHALSGVSQQNCKLFNLIDGKAICVEYADPVVVQDKSSRSKEAQIATTPNFQSSEPNRTDSAIDLVSADSEQLSSEGVRVEVLSRKD